MTAGDAGGAAAAAPREPARPDGGSLVGAGGGGAAAAGGGLADQVDDGVDPRGAGVEAGDQAEGLAAGALEVVELVRHAMRLEPLQRLLASAARRIVIDSDLGHRKRSPARGVTLTLSDSIELGAWARP